MRVLIVGGAGMLGHKLCQQFRSKFETWATVRSNVDSYTQQGIFEAHRIIAGVEVTDFDSVVRAMGKARPDAVINCIGIIKQLKAAKDPILSLNINSLFPHRLANLCAASGARMIHISTDCVFSGRKGSYTESDVSDAEDLYGRTKFLGEVDHPGCLTLRTSIIGRELQTTSGLVEWFLSNKGKSVSGYTRAIYSGFTTLALSEIIAEILERFPNLSGVYQVSSDPINKYDLLLLMRRAFDIDIEILPSEEVMIDRSLASARFRSETGFVPTSWPEMVNRMAQEDIPYDILRGNRES